MSFRGRYIIAFGGAGVHLYYINARGDKVKERVGFEHIDLYFNNPVAFDELVLRPRLEGE